MSWCLGKDSTFCNVFKVSDRTTGPTGTEGNSEGGGDDFGEMYICKVEWRTTTRERLLMYIWGRNAMELYGMSLGKRRSPWNIVEGGVGKHELHRGRFQKRYRAWKQGEKGLGLWWVLVASTVFQCPRSRSCQPGTTPFSPQLLNT